MNKRDMEEREMEEREMKEREKGQLAEQESESKIGEIGEIGETSAGASKCMCFTMVLPRTCFFLKKQVRALIMRTHRPFDIAALVLSYFTYFTCFVFLTWRLTNSKNETWKNEKWKHEK